MPVHRLTPDFFHIHKEKMGASEFGLDNSTDLICGGFGLYSTSGLKPKIGPIKSEFFRIGFGVRGTVQLHCGLEQYLFQPGHIAFTIPGQVFSLQDKSDDFFAYYMFFTDKFIADAISLKNIREDYPFLHYSGFYSFELQAKEATEIQQLILKINDEIKTAADDLKTIIQLLVHLILVQANRSYPKIQSPADAPRKQEQLQVIQFKKLVSEHFLSKRKVSDYAVMMHISPNHLSRIVKKETGVTAFNLIEDMLLLEAKALIIHTPLSVAEIAYQLDFSDPSHFNKFFKKRTGITPLQFRTS